MFAKAYAANNFQTEAEANKAHGSSLGSRCRNIKPSCSNTPRSQLATSSQSALEIASNCDQWVPAWRCAIENVVRISRVTLWTFRIESEDDFLWSWAIDCFAADEFPFTCMTSTRFGARGRCRPVTININVARVGAHVMLKMNSVQPDAQYRFCTAGFSNGRSAAVIKVSALMHAGQRKFANFNGNSGGRIAKWFRALALQGSAEWWMEFTLAMQSKVPFSWYIPLTNCFCWNKYYWRLKSFSAPQRAWKYFPPSVNLDETLLADKWWLDIIWFIDLNMIVPCATNKKPQSSFCLRKQSNVNVTTRATHLITRA